jgi:hypothetical protein
VGNSNRSYAAPVAIPSIEPKVTGSGWASVARPDNANVFNASVPRRPADVTLLRTSQLTADTVDGLATTLASAVSHTQVFIPPIGLEEGFPGARVGKNILIFSDGTGQAGGYMPDETRSNVY